MTIKQSHCQLRQNKTGTDKPTHSHIYKYNYINYIYKYNYKYEYVAWIKRNILSSNCQ